MSKEKMNAAVIGAGKMGLVHASILSTLPDVELIALCDKSSLIRKLLVGMLGKNRVFAELESVLDLDVDVIYVTTPIPSHYSVIKKLYSRKKNANVFVEKTLACSYGDSMKLCELASDAKTAKNMVGYMKRFAVTFQKARDLLNEDAIGEVFSFEAHAYSSDFFGVKEISKTPSSRGGVLNDLGSHVIDLALWLFGDFEVQSAVQPVATDIQNAVNFKVKNANQIEGTFDVSWCMEGYHVPEFGLSIQGSKGKIKVDDDILKIEKSPLGSLHWHKHDLNDNVGFLLGAPEYYREDDYFVKSILSGVDPETNFSNASKVDQIIEKVTGGASAN
jgi:predicted dehydrogenase